MSSPAATRSQSPLARLRMERDRFVAFAFSWADMLFELDETSRIVYATGVLEPLGPGGISKAPLFAIS